MYTKLRERTETEIAWLAGLLEGEGCFTWSCKRGHYGHPQVHVAMIDLDTIERAHKLIGTDIGIGRQENLYRISYASGAAHEIMVVLESHMSARRKLRISDLIQKWDGRPGRKGRYYPRGEELAHTKLSDRQVQDIRSMKGEKLGRDIAKEYGVSESLISAILTGKHRKGE